VYIAEVVGRGLEVGGVVDAFYHIQQADGVEFEDAFGAGGFIAGENKDIPDTCFLVACQCASQSVCIVVFAGEVGDEVKPAKQVFEADMAEDVCRVDVGYAAGAFGDGDCSEVECWRDGVGTGDFVSAEEIFDGGEAEIGPACQLCEDEKTRFLE